MSRLRVRLTGPGTTETLHQASGATLGTASAPEFGGPGGAFSSTDLVAAALGTCIASSLQPVAAREGIDAEEIVLTVDKTLSPKARRIASLAVAISVPRPLADPQRRKLLAAARTCAVHRSLAPEVVVSIDLRSSGDR